MKYIFVFCCDTFLYLRYIQITKLPTDHCAVGINKSIAKTLSSYLSYAHKVRIAGID